MTKFFRIVNPVNIQIGDVFDVSSYEHWSVAEYSWRIGQDAQMWEGDRPLDRNDPALVQNIPKRIYAPDDPTNNYLIDGLPHFIRGGEDAIFIILATRGGKSAAIPAVSDRRLSNIVRDLFKGALTRRPIGTGSTADAVRHELATGQPVGGKWHTQKAQDYARALEKWLQKNPNASHRDRMVAQSLLDDLKSALSGK